MQYELIPLEIVRLDPPQKGADIDGIGEAIDGHQYAVKSVTKRADLPATEWICSSLAEDVHIPVPPFRIVKHPGGMLAFGSRWEGGKREDYNDRQRGVLTNRLTLVQGDEVFSAIYAFDLFVHNVDRHANNYIFREQNKKVVIMAMDFSRSLLFNGWPLPPPPVPVGCTTRATYRQLQQHYPFNLVAAERVLLNLAKLSVDRIKTILATLDDTWLDDVKKQEIEDWWGSRERKRRLVMIRKGLRNGQYL